MINDKILADSETPLNVEKSPSQTISWIQSICYRQIWVPWFELSPLTVLGNRNLVVMITPTPFQN